MVDLQDTLRDIIGELTVDDFKDYHTFCFIIL